MVYFVLALPSADVATIAISVRGPVSLTATGEPEAAATPFTLRLFDRVDIVTGVTRISAA